MRTRGQAVEKRYCGVCGDVQVTSEGGVTCVNGHGGVPSVGVERACAIKQQAEDEEHARDKAIRAASAPLAEEMAKADQPLPGQFRHARGQQGEHSLNPRVQRIVESVFVDDPDEVYERLEKILKVGENRSNRGALMAALDEAETNARLAHRLMVTAKYEQERWEGENKAVFSAMREEANGALQREKDSKTRSKAITDADVDGMAAIMFPDEYGAQQVKRRRVELMVKSMENMVEVWDSRCRTLRTMLESLR